MTCRDLKGGSAAATMARRSSGLPDSEVLSLLHKAKAYALERQAGPPTAEEVADWADSQADRVRADPALASDEPARSRLLNRLELARTETPDGPTFASWRAVEAASEAVTWDISPDTAAKQAVRRLRRTAADEQALQDAKPAGRHRPPRLLAGPPPPPRPGDDRDAAQVTDAQFQAYLPEIRQPEGIDDGGRWTAWGPNFRLVSQPKTLSGWKLHVAAGNGPEAADAAQRLFAVAKERGLGMKVATANLTEKYQGPDAARQGTKGVTVYLPRGATADADTSAVVAALDGYRTSARVGGAGEQHVAGAVYSRWEFGNRDPGRDVTPAEGERLYVEAAD